MSPSEVMSGNDETVVVVTCNSSVRAKQLGQGISNLSTERSAKCVRAPYQDGQDKRTKHRQASKSFQSAAQYGELAETPVPGSSLAGNWSWLLLATIGG